MSVRPTTNGSPLTCSACVLVIYWSVFSGQECGFQPAASTDLLCWSKFSRHLRAQATTCLPRLNPRATAANAQIKSRAKANKLSLDRLVMDFGSSPFGQLDRQAYCAPRATPTNKQIPALPATNAPPVTPYAYWRNSHPFPFATCRPLYAINLSILQFHIQPPILNESVMVRA